MKLFKTALIAALCIIMAVSAGCSGAFSGSTGHDTTPLPSGQGASSVEATPRFG